MPLINRSDIKAVFHVAEIAKQKKTQICLSFFVVAESA